MGCCASAPIEEVNYDAIPICDGKSERLTLSQVDNPIGGRMPQTSGMMSMDPAANREMKVEMRQEKEGVIYADVCGHASQGMELLCTVAKIGRIMPKISYVSGEGLKMTMPNTSICLYRALASARQSLDTVAVKEHFKVSSAHQTVGVIKWTNSKVASAGSSEVASGIDQTIMNQTAQGYRLKGGSVVSMSSRTQGGGQGLGVAPGAQMERHNQTESDMEVELLFQKLEDPERDLPTEAVMASYAITKRQHSESGGGIGGTVQISTDIPDIVGHLNEQGKEGWELSSLLTLPPKMTMEGAHENRVLTHDQSYQTMITTTPVMAILERRPEATPVKYTCITYTYHMSFGRFRGDMTPTIVAYAEKGWILRGMVTLPLGKTHWNGPGAMVQYAMAEMQVMLFFAENDQRREYGQRQV